MPISERIPGLGSPDGPLAKTLDWSGERALRGLAWYASPRVSPSWEKVAIIRRLLEEYEFVLWIDADAMIVDASHDIMSDISPDRWLHAVEHTIGESHHFNVGVLGVTSCAASRRYFADLDRQRQYLIHAWWEQAAMLYLMGYRLWPHERMRRTRSTRYTIGLDLVGPRWNSIPDVAEVPNPYIIHFAGKSFPEKLEGMRRVAGL